jgi:hypothetical protein
MNPPRVYEVTIPSSQRISKMTKMVQSIEVSFSPRGGIFPDPGTPSRVCKSGAESRSLPARTYNPLHPCASR